MKKEEKKEITTRTAVKAIITGYIAYGILVGFIMFVVGIVVNWCLGLLPNANNNILMVTVPLIGVVLLYMVLHVVCKMSIHDVFKKCKTNPNNLQKIISRMNLFVIICIIIDVIASVGILLINFNNQEQAIEIASYKYSSIHSEQFTSELTNEMIREYSEAKTRTIVSTIILELGMVVAWLSVIPLQKKLIIGYNEV